VDEGRGVTTLLLSKGGGRVCDWWVSGCGEGCNDFVAAMTETQHGERDAREHGGVNERSSVVNSA
jgi:hypothetical protein